MKNLARNNKERLLIMARKSAIVTPVKRKSRKIQSPTDYSIQFDDYLNHCEERNLTQGTVESYRFYLGYLKKYLEENQHSLLVDDIMERDLKDFLTFMRKTKGNNQATLNSAIASIRPFFNYLIGQEVIQDHPMARIKKGKVDQKPIIPFSNEDIHNLLQQPDKSRHAGYRDYAMMLMLLSTGMRISECLNLTISDIDLPGRSGRLLPHNPHRPGRADFPHPVPLITDLLNVVVHYFGHWKWIMFEKISERTPASFTLPRSPVKPLEP